MMDSSINGRRHSLPSTSTVNLIPRKYIERSCSSPSIRDSFAEEEYNDIEDDQKTSITSISLPEQLEDCLNSEIPTNLNQLWERRFEQFESRLTSLEVTKKRFESRLQALECANKPIILHEHQPLLDHSYNAASKYSTNALSSAPQEGAVSKQKYLDLLNVHHSLLNVYNTMQVEFQEKEKYYKQRIQDLISENNKKLQEKDHEEEEPSYKEEDGYLIFDTTNMNGEVIHCRVKIPTAPVSPPATRVGSPQHPLTPLPSNNVPVKKKKGLNFYAPEWKAHRS